MAPALAVPALLASSALTMTGQIMKGREEARSQLVQEQGLKTQEQQVRTAADQDEAARRESLNGQIETINAIRAGRGVGMTSATGLASLNALTQNVEGDIRTSRANYTSKADSLRLAADSAGRAADYSLLSGFVGAGATALGTGYKLSGGVDLTAPKTVP